MSRSPQPRPAVESPPRHRPLTAPIRTAVAKRIYFDDADGAPGIIDVPLDVDHRPIADGVVGTHVRVNEIDRDGSSIWCVYRVRA